MHYNSYTILWLCSSFEDKCMIIRSACSFLSSVNDSSNGVITDTKSVSNKADWFSGQSATRLANPAIAPSWSWGEEMACTKYLNKPFSLIAC